MNKGMLIGIAGQKQVGKTTAADVLAERHGFIHVSFAEPIRRFTCDLLDMTPERLEREKEDPIPWLDFNVSPRQIMQRLGTEFGRELIHPDLWVRRLMRKVSALRHSGASVVVSDVRFDNEASAIKLAGGKIVLVRRRNVFPGLESDVHRSEGGIDPAMVDEVLYNDFSGVGSYADDVSNALEVMQQEATS